MQVFSNVSSCSRVFNPPILLFAMFANRGMEDPLTEIGKLEKGVGQGRREEGCVEQACISGCLC